MESTSSEKSLSTPAKGDNLHETKITCVTNYQACFDDEDCWRSIDWYKNDSKTVTTGEGRTRSVKRTRRTSKRTRRKSNWRVILFGLCMGMAMYKLVKSNVAKRASIFNSSKLCPS
ncbi:hypothetical protein Pyn_25575 [Prunus yedoensis var. nudiflora]|uniref:Uncharacterized protein n=1 Tax=Prunus yedoensis var. nudiflora TaxID=2094558 RepID=A0A314V598_PRUYE|nr:hypothetical protein Pyn_25575 [Prunus yedoensis var. nudiflora]